MQELQQQDIEEHEYLPGGLFEDDGRDPEHWLLSQAEESLMHGVASTLLENLDILGWRDEQMDDIKELAWVNMTRSTRPSRWLTGMAPFPVTDEEKVKAHSLRDFDSSGTLTATEWHLLKKVWHYRCAYCGCNPRPLCLEHVHPIYYGGTTELDNVVPSCVHCNSTKRHHTIDELMSDGGQDKFDRIRFRKAEAVRRFIRMREKAKRVN